MGRGVRIAGTILLIIGVIVLVFGLYTTYTPISSTDGLGQYASFNPNGLGPHVSTIRWSGATNSTTFYVTTSTPTCTASQSGVVATGTGTGGSVSVVLNSGTTYYLVACTGGFISGATVSVSTVGLSWLVIIGIVLIVIGIVLRSIGKRPANAPEPMAVTPPMS